MQRPFRFASRALAGIVGAALFAAPAAVLAQEPASSIPSVPPKVTKLGTARAEVVSAGVVIVEVLVRPDGTFAVRNIVHSTNHADDAPALQIAKSSRYAPALKDGKPVVALYDFTLRFAGSALDPYERMIFEHGNYAQAKSKLGPYLAAHPTDARAHRDLGIADTFLGRYDEATTAFDRAGSIPPRYRDIAAKAYSERAVALIDRKNYDAALAPARRAAELTPDATTNDNLALAEMNSGHVDESIAGFRKARQVAITENAPADQRARISANLAAALASQGKIDEAKQYAAEAKQLDPSANGGYLGISRYHADEAAAHLKLGHYAVAASVYEQAAGEAPDNAVTLYDNAAFAYLQEKPKPANDKAKADVNKALAIDPNDPAANYALGIVLANEGKKRDALVALDKADAAAKNGTDATLTGNIENTIKRLSGAHNNH